MAPVEAHPQAYTLSALFVFSSIYCTIFSSLNFLFSCLLWAFEACLVIICCHGDHFIKQFKQTELLAGCIIFIIYWNTKIYINKFGSFIFHPVWNITKYLQVWTDFYWPWADRPVLISSCLNHNHVDLQHIFEQLELYQ